MNSLVKQVLDRLVEQIEAGKNPWKKSWKTSGGMPINATTNKTYRGINTLILWLAADTNGYASNEWATFKQWSANGRYVRKDEKGTAILFYKMLEKGEGDDAQRIPMLRVSWVFNTAQLVAAEAEPQVTETQPPEQRHAKAQAWIETLGIVHAAGPPSYSPTLDQLFMPAPADFTDLDEYWSTMLHEIVHWTGHKSRLDRQMTQNALAAEELVAEIGAAFMCAEFGIDTEKNNAAYLRHWLSNFEDKRQAIFTAAKDAGKAYEFLTRQPAAMEQAA